MVFAESADKFADLIRIASSKDALFDWCCFMTQLVCDDPSDTLHWTIMNQPG